MDAFLYIQLQFLSNFWSFFQKGDLRVFLHKNFTWKIEGKVVINEDCDETFKVRNNKETSSNKDKILQLIILTNRQQYVTHLLGVPKGFYIPQSHHQIEDPEDEKITPEFERLFAVFWLARPDLALPSPAPPGPAQPGMAWPTTSWQKIVS